MELLELPVDLKTIHWERGFHGTNTVLYASVSIAGCPFHMQAIQVEGTAPHQTRFVTNLEVQDALDKLLEMEEADHGLYTVTLFGKPYVLTIVPFSH